MLENLKLAIIKERNDKLNKQTILWSAMMNYTFKHGENSVFINKISQEELNNVTSSDLLDLIKNLTSYKHRITYYGPEKINEVSNSLNTYHKSNIYLKQIQEATIYEELPLDIPYSFCCRLRNLNRAEILLLLKGGELNVSDIPKIKFHNSYFGGGMSSIVFQDMQRVENLAYSVYVNLLCT